MSLNHVLHNALQSVGSPKASPVVVQKPISVRPKDRRRQEDRKPIDDVHLTAQFAPSVIESLSQVPHAWADSRTIQRLMKDGAMAFAIAPGNGAFSGQAITIANGRFCGRSGFMKEIASIAVPLGMGRLALRFEAHFAFENGRASHWIELI
jgi:hypothetical protein